MRQARPLREQLFLRILGLFIFGSVTMVSFLAFALVSGLMQAADCLEYLKWMLGIVAGWVGTAVGYFFGSQQLKEQSLPSIATSPARRPTR